MGDKYSYDLSGTFDAYRSLFWRGLQLYDQQTNEYIILNSAQFSIMAS